MDEPKVTIKCTEKQHFFINNALLYNHNCWRAPSNSCERNEKGGIDCQKCIDKNITWIITDEEGGEK